MLRNLWGVSVKVPNLERELDFHRQVGSRIGTSFTFELEGESFRVVYVVTDDRRAHQYLFLAERHIIEHQLGESLPYGITHALYYSGAWGIDDMKQQAAEIVAAGGTLLSGPFRLAPDQENPFIPDKKNPETFAMLFQSPGGYIFELFTLEAFDRMDWIYHPRED